MKTIHRVVAASLVSLLCSAGAGAASITIDFEHLPGADGVLGTADDLPASDIMIDDVGEKYAAVGVHFTEGSVFHANFYNGDPNNHFLSWQPPAATFSVPVYGISLDSHSIWTMTMRAYDVNGNVLATTVKERPLDSARFYDTTISVTSSVPIYRFSILPPVSGQILNLDNMVLTTTAPVPEPSSYAMLLAGLALTAGYARRRSR